MCVVPVSQPPAVLGVGTKVLDGAGRVEVELVSLELAVAALLLVPEGGRVGFPHQVDLMLQNLPYITDNVVQRSIGCG